MQLRQFLILHILLLSTLPARSQIPEALLEQASEAFRKRNYAAAIEGYESLLAAGYRSTALYYNLGNSYYRAGQYGRAVLNYERARMLDPHDADIAHNLAIVRQQLPDQFEPLPAFFLSRWWHGVGGWIGPDGWGWLGLVLLWSGAAGIAFWLQGRTRRQRKWGFALGITLALGSMLPFALAASRQAALTDSGRGVVLAGEVVLYSAPDPQSKSLLTLHAGVTVELLDTLGEWRLVRLPDGEEGWLPEHSMEKV